MGHNPLNHIWSQPQASDAKQGLDLTLAHIMSSDDLSQKERFQKSFRINLISTSEIEVIALSKFAGFEKIQVTVGDTFKGPVDKHSRVTYKVKSVGEDGVELAYESVFDARSFGDGVNRSEGVFFVVGRNILTSNYDTEV